MIFLSQSFLLDLFLSRLLVSYKKILSTFFTRLILFVSFSWLSFRFRFFCLHAFLSFRINLFKLAFFLNMKIIFAFRTRLSFLSKEKTLYTICYAVVNLLSRTTQSYLRQQPLSLRALALRSGLSVRFPVPLPFAPLHRSTSFKINRWWAQMDSDHRPHAYQACALTS